MSNIVTPLSRRDFGRLTVGTLALGGMTSSLPAAKPITRNGSSHMKLSLAAYSFHRFLTQSWPRPSGEAGSMTMLDFIDFCAEQNLDGCELTSYYFPAGPPDHTEPIFNKIPQTSKRFTNSNADSPLQVVPHEFLMQIKDRTFRLGLDISGTAIGNDFCLPEGDDREFHLQMTRQWIDYAATMGAPVIRIFAGNILKGDTESVVLDRCVEGINQSVAYAAEKGVVLALENHGGITATPEQLLAIVERVDDSPWFGVNFDGGNFHTADPYASLEMIAPYAVNAQLKVSVHPAGAEREKADLGRMIGILKSAGYRGYVVLEYEEETDPHESIPPLLTELRELIA